MFRRIDTATCGAMPLVFVIAGLIGCASDRDLDSVSVASQGLSIRDLRGEVNPGERGFAVRLVYGYLQRFGYFPNAELEKEYPQWAPLVPDAPEDPEFYGPEIEEGVAQFQRYMGLPRTGRVDAETLRTMQLPRCAHPENEFATRDESEQWALTGSKWNKTTITYRIVTAGSTEQNGLTFANTSSALDVALLGWHAVTFLTLQQITSGTPDTEIKIWPVDGHVPTSSQWLVGGAQFNFGAADAMITGKASGQRRVGLNDGGGPGLQTVKWSSNLTPLTWDISTVLQHEIGHTLGFAHSSAPLSPLPNGKPPLMAAATASATRIPVQPDDLQAASSLYQLWGSKPGAALDIAAGGPAPGSPKVYAAGSSNTLWFWKTNGTAPDFGSWQLLVADAIAVAVNDAGLPWVVSSNHTIWQGNGSDPLSANFTWVAKSMGSAANDIAAGGGGPGVPGNTVTQPQVWIISNTPAPGSTGNFVVQRFTGSGWDSSNGGIGRRIAVNWIGRPWVVQNNNTVWRFYVPGDDINTRSSTGTPAWEKLLQGLTPDTTPDTRPAACGHDIGAGLDHSVWLIGCTSHGSDFDIWHWDEQRFDPSGSQTFAQHQFVAVDGFGLHVTAAPDGRPWVTQANLSVWRRAPTASSP